MEFPILDNLKQKFPSHTSLIDQFVVLFNQKLWHQLTQNIFKFIYSSDVLGHLQLTFYTDFVKKFSRNIDQINNLKMLKQSLCNVLPNQAITFLKNYQQNQAFTHQCKTILAGIRGFFLLKKQKDIDFDMCSQIYHRINNYLKQHKEVDAFTYSTFYKFSMMYFLSRQKQKLFYENALQYFAYTPQNQIQYKQKIYTLVQMGVSLLISPQIYNFSELMEQPMLQSLINSQHKQIYQLLGIFNKGDIKGYKNLIQKFTQNNSQFKEARQQLDTKIEIMAFMEAAFNLPKNDRVITFKQLKEICMINIQDVQRMVMRTASLGLLKVQIDQIAQTITIKWIKPKVLSSQRIGVMLGKFEEWDQGVNGIQKFISENRKIKV